MQMLSVSDFRVNLGLGSGCPEVLMGSLRAISMLVSQNVTVGAIHDEGSGLETLARGIGLLVEDFLGFLHQSAFAKLRIILVRFASAILESLSFPVYVFEWVCILLIFHDVPLTWCCLKSNGSINPLDALSLRESQCLKRCLISDD